MVLKGRNADEQRADSINDAVERLLEVRSELDPSYTPPVPKKESSLMEIINFLHDCLLALIGLGLLAGIIFVITVFAAGIFS